MTINYVLKPPRPEVDQHDHTVLHRFLLDAHLCVIRTPLVSYAAPMSTQLYPLSWEPEPIPPVCAPFLSFASVVLWQWVRQWTIGRVGAEEQPGHRRPSLGHRQQQPHAAVGGRHRPR